MLRLMCDEIRDMPTRQKATVWLLYRLMSGLSERYFCAGWLDGLEFSLWSAAHGLGKVRRFISRCDAEHLRKLSKRAGGWIVWDDGPRFVSMEKWLETLSASPSTEQCSQHHPSSKEIQAH
jgi:hypothetical protein